MLRTLGGLSLEGSDFRWQKPLLLLTFVALEGRQTRREVAELFWPSAADRMKSLSVALTQLRHGVPGVVRADRRDLEVDVEIDVAHFRRALEDGDLERALRLYQGRFLDGFDERHVGTDLEAWIYETREREAERLRYALLADARARASSGEVGAAALLAARAFELPGATPPDPVVLTELHAMLVAAGNPLARQVASDAAELGLELDAVQVASSPRTPLVGREAELARARALLDDPDVRIVTLAGPGGVGKTRLAVELARRLSNAGLAAGGLPVAGPVALEEVRTAGQLFREIASALGMLVGGGQSADLLERQLAERLRETPALVVLDGCEHLADGSCSAALARVLAAAPRARALVTSRAPLQVAGERVIRLEGLPLGTEDDGGLASGPAERLFEICAQRAAPGFDAERQREAVHRCCSLLDGLPLGIELSAAWAGTLTVEAIIEEIRRDPGFLSRDGDDGQGPSAPVRDAGLRSVFERSWALLGASERRAFAALAVFEGGFARAAASFVAEVDATVLRRLVGDSLVTFDAGTGRYRVHELVRAFAAERLEALGASEAVLARLAAYYCSWMHARERDLEGAGQAAATDAIARDLPNVRTAFLHAAATGARPLLEQAATALARYYERRGPFSEGIDVFRTAASLLGNSGTRDALVATLHAHLAAFARLQGDAKASQAAIASGRDHLPAPGRRGDVASARARARLQHQAGVLALGSDNLIAAQALGRAAAGFRATGLAWEEARALGSRGLALLGQGRDAEATGALEEALDAATALGDAAGTADLLATAAWAAALHGRSDEAEGLLRASERAYDEAGDMAGAAAGYGRLGMTAVWLGAFDPAKALFDKSLAAHRAIGEWWSLPEAHAAVGLGHLHIGAYLETDREARTGLGMARRLANPVAEAHSLWLLGATALTRDDFETAAGRFRNSVALCRIGHEAHEAIPSVALLAMAYRGLGRRERAWSVARVALRRSVEAVDLRALTLSLSAFTLLLAEAGELTAAAAVSALLGRYAIVRNCRFFQEMSARHLMPKLAPLEPGAAQQASALVHDLDAWRAAGTLAQCRGADEAALRLEARAAAPTGAPARGPEAL